MPSEPTSSESPAPAPTPSTDPRLEHRLHPASILFNLAGQAKELLVPGLIVLFSARRGDAWQVWGMLLLIPYVLIAVSRYVSFRYRYEERELAMRWGLVFRKERHIPYGRIQNLDAVQNPFHRLFGVATVRLETGGGDEPEARMSVLPLDAFDEMRHRVFEGRSALAAKPVETEAAAPSRPAVRGVTLLQLEPRALMVAGLIENRGMVLIAAALGIIWEAGLGDGLMDRIFGEQSPGRGPLRRVFAALVGRGAMPWRELAFMVAVFVSALVAIRLLSMIWGLIRLSGFTLTRTGEDLRSTYGLFTRVTATIPMRRIQTLTIVEGPWHQLFGWVAVRVTTAGGRGREGATSEREWLAPIIRRDALPAFLQDVLPEVQVDSLPWERVHPRAFGRELRGSLVVSTILAGSLAMVLGWWAVVVFAALLAWSAIAARQFVRHAAWSSSDRAVAYRTGWLWRHTTIARATRIQAVSLGESPFDRRTGMASLSVDTAGGDRTYAVDIPYLPRDVAGTLYSSLSSQAARTEFTW
jgi:putative membrane protein